VKSENRYHRSRIRLLPGREHYLIIDSSNDTEKALARRMELDHVAGIINSLLRVGVDGRMARRRFLQYVGGEHRDVLYAELKATYTESNLKILSIVVLRYEYRVDLIRNT
jgi:hypothetical protein